MKLKIELVPMSAWFQNYRNKYPDKWKAQKQACYKAAGYRCEICNGKGPQWPVEAHEVWEWDEIHHIQKLIRLIALCPDCHEVKHFGLASSRGRSQEAMEHLMKVNRWDELTARQHIHYAFKQWQKRSRITWALDCSVLEE